MKKLWKKIYTLITCYDPIIEELRMVDMPDDNSQFAKYYVASPIQPNRKQRREFCFSFEITESSDCNNVRVLARE